MRLPSSLFFLRFLFVFTGIVLIVIGGFLTSDSIPPNPYLGVQPDLPDPDGVQWKYLNRAAGRGAIISGLFILLSQVVLAYVRIKQFGRYVGLSLLLAAIGLLLASYFANQMIL